MSIDAEMTIDERRKYLRKMQKRYRQAKREAKSKLLAEIQEVSGLHRKSLVRLMASGLERRPRQRQRGRSYGTDVAYAIGVIAESLDWVCAERLQPNLVWVAQHLAAHGELETTPTLLEKLGKVSISTVRRILSRQKRERPRLPRKRPERANRLAREIPAERIPWQEQQAGHFECFRNRNQYPCLGVPENAGLPPHMFFNLGHPHWGIDWNWNRPCVQRAKKRIEELRARRQHDRHAVLV